LATTRPSLTVTELCAGSASTEKVVPLDFRYRFVGTAVRPHMNADWTGKWMSEISFQRSPSAIWENHRSVALSGEPAFIRPDYVGPLSDYLFVEAALLPLSDDGLSVTKIMVFIDFLRRAELRAAAVSSGRHPEPIRPH
jgi:hypothetical protein